MSTYFAHVVALSGYIPHLPQRSLVARGQSTVDELDRRLRPDRSILPLIDSADNRCVDKHTSCRLAVLSKDGPRGARLLRRRRRPSGIDIESPAATREITGSPIHAVQTPSRASLARSEGQPSTDTKLSSRREGDTPTVFTRRQETAAILLLLSLFPPFFFK